jgi:hypothetical protein
MACPPSLFRGPSPALKWPEHEVNRLPPSSAYVKKECNYASTVAYAFMTSKEITLSLLLLFLFCFCEELIAKL